MAVMEDEDNDVMPVSLYQQDDEEFCRAVDIVDIETVLLIKEPYFKLNADGEYGLRIDHPSDVVRLQRNDNLVPQAWRSSLSDNELSAEALKAKGNQAVQGRNFWTAIAWYSAALRRPASPEQLEIIRRNRSLAYLKTRQFDAALADTGFPNFGANSDVKAFFRAAESLYNLARFEECSSVLESLLKVFPDNVSAMELLKRAQLRIGEQSTGTYDFKHFRACARDRRPPELDFATYVGSMQVKHTHTKGRGWFVTKSVKAGELLLCEKAYSHAYACVEEKGAMSKISTLLNPETNKGVTGTEADLIKQIIQKLYRSPSLTKAFTTLFSGDYEKVSISFVDDLPVVDSFLVDRIVSLNVFGCPLSSLDTFKEAMEHGTVKNSYHSCGIWTQASFINHSCDSTARRSFIGDMMIVRAIRDLEPDTEVTFQYTSLTDVDLRKQQENLHNWGFECDCLICIDAKATSSNTFLTRKNLREEAGQMVKSSIPENLHTDIFEQLLVRIESTYPKPADQVPRLHLWDLQIALAQAFIKKKNIVGTLGALHRMLTSLGFVVKGMDVSSSNFAIVKWGAFMNQLLEAFLMARASFLSIRAIENARQAEEYARVAHKIVVGEDTSFVDTHRLEPL